MHISGWRFYWFRLYYCCIVQPQYSLTCSPIHQCHSSVVTGNIYTLLSAVSSPLLLHSLFRFLFNCSITPRLFLNSPSDISCVILLLLYCFLTLSSQSFPIHNLLNMKICIKPSNKVTLWFAQLLLCTHVKCVFSKGMCKNTPMPPSKKPRQTDGACVSVKIYTWLIPQG